MKKSNLKYIFLILLVSVVFYIYQLNKQTYIPTSNLSNSSSDFSGTPSSSQGLTFSNREGSSEGSATTDSDVNNSNQYNTVSSSSGSGVSSGTNFEDNEFSFLNDIQENSSSEDLAISYTNSNGNSSVNSGGGAGIGLGLPIGGGLQTFTVEENEKNKESKRNNNSAETSNQTAKKGNFFSGGGGGQLETPMAPGTPDDEPIPLDGGVSLLIALGSLFGVRKLFLTKKN